MSQDLVQFHPRRSTSLRLLVVLAVAWASTSEARAAGTVWIGTWAATPQPPPAGSVERYEDQTLRLVVRVSAGGAQLRLRFSNAYGTVPLHLGAVHVARRSRGADIDSATDRRVTFSGREGVTVPAGATAVSDPVPLSVPALSELAVSLYLPEATEARTSHLLALRTSYAAAGNAVASAQLPAAQPLDSWPFLGGVDVEAPRGAAALVAFGDSQVDGDGSTADTDRRWPDVLAERLQRRRPPGAPRGVLNAGLIGNRLLRDGPSAQSHPVGPALGPAALARFERDVLLQPGVRYAIVRLGINDIGLPGCIAPESERVSAEALIAGFRELVTRAHRRGIRLVGTTLSPFEGAVGPKPGYFSPEKERVRVQVNAWLRGGHTGFDAVVDFDALLRDPEHPARLLPRYDSGDHLHPNDAGYAVLGEAFPLALFGT
ncbi:MULTISPECIES: SGNH/GDSL hydrolase family protein [Myxococcaceae]|uniref:SGNH/GDSL hydrolase family protein n=1 Tax=Myxococcaceae TaxID=31 RepID=UPI00188E7B45|nr:MULTISPECIES: SGNH/GDSL hydrolase family protein [Myxococcaceae]MBF5045792.1 SGNH/GDSL hydrolase family protein [Simulacricoccus sp. 17bor-14]